MISTFGDARRDNLKRIHNDDGKLWSLSSYTSHLNYMRLTDFFHQRSYSSSTQYVTCYNSFIEHMMERVIRLKKLSVAIIIPPSTLALLSVSKVGIFRKTIAEYVHK